jgi:hypothetical protein
MNLVGSFFWCFFFWIVGIDRYPTFVYHFGVHVVGNIYQVRSTTVTTENLEI